MMIAYTCSDEIAKMNRIPTFMSEITHPGAQGITAQTITGSTKETIGARKNTALSAPDGMTISLTMYFSMSAKHCKSPHGPTTFGPRRSCTAAQILRSAYIRNARLTRMMTITSRHCAEDQQEEPEAVGEEADVHPLLRRHLVGALAARAAPDPPSPRSPAGPGSRG